MYYKEKKVLINFMCKMIVILNNIYFNDWWIKVLNLSICVFVKYFYYVWYYIVWGNYFLLFLLVNKYNIVILEVKYILYVCM